jgi:hypothetical protein
MKEYTSPELEIINFESADVITTSTDPEVTPLG